VNQYSNTVSRFAVIERPLTYKRTKTEKNQNQPNQPPDQDEKKSIDPVNQSIIPIDEDQNQPTNQDDKTSGDVNQSIIPFVQDQNQPPHQDEKVSEGLVDQSIIHDEDLLDSEVNADPDYKPLDSTDYKPLESPAYYTDTEDDNDDDKDVPDNNQSNMTDEDDEYNFEEETKNHMLDMLSSLDDDEINQETDSENSEEGKTVPDDEQKGIELENLRDDNQNNNNNQSIIVEDAKATTQQCHYCNLSFDAGSIRKHLASYHQLPYNLNVTQKFNFDQKYHCLICDSFQHSVGRATAHFKDKHKIKRSEMLNGAPYDPPKKYFLLIAKTTVECPNHQYFESKNFEPRLLTEDLENKVDENALCFLNEEYEIIGHTPAFISKILKPLLKWVRIKVGKFTKPSQDKKFPTVKLLVGLSEEAEDVMGLIFHELKKLPDMEFLADFMETLVKLQIQLLAPDETAMVIDRTENELGRKLSIEAKQFKTFDMNWPTNVKKECLNTVGQTKFLEMVWAYGVARDCVLRKLEHKEIHLLNSPIENHQQARLIIYHMIGGGIRSFQKKHGSCSAVVDTLVTTQAPTFYNYLRSRGSLW